MKTVSLLLVCCICIKLADVKASRYKRICYFSGWSLKRHSPFGRFNFNEFEIDAKLCSHIIYAFAKVQAGILTLEASDLDDLPRNGKKGNFAIINDLKKKNPKLKTMLSIGGAKAEAYTWNIISRTANNRMVFAKNAATILHKWGFDGLDLDWEYPGDVESGNSLSSKQDFTALVLDIMMGFKNYAEEHKTKRLLLSAAVPISPDIIEKGYEVSAIARSLDFISVMAYHFHDPRETITGLNSPLFSRHTKDERFNETRNIKWAIDRWLKGGVPKDKLILGLSAQGVSYTLVSENEKDVGDKASGPGIQGPYIQELGSLAYFEICKILNDGAKREWDEIQVSPYAHRNRLWVGFDDPVSIKNKTRWAVEMGLGGAMIWSLDLDDFSGKHCNLGKFPLTTAMSAELVQAEDRYLLSKIGTRPPVDTKSVKTSSGKSESNKNNNGEESSSSTRNMCHFYLTLTLLAIHTVLIRVNINN